jgi:hypothetical protein
LLLLHDTPPAVSSQEGTFSHTNDLFSGVVIPECCNRVSYVRFPLIPIDVINRDGNDLLCNYRKLCFHMTHPCGPLSRGDVLYSNVRKELHSRLSKALEYNSSTTASFEAELQRFTFPNTCPTLLFRRGVWE